LFSRAKIAVQIATGRANWKPFFMLGLTTALMQLGTLITFNAMQVGYSLALFQTSTLLSVLLGHRLFQEQHFVERMIGSIVMVGGAVLIIISR
jgi:drug/metabolite transporter (DMT)-like permease